MTRIGNNEFFETLRGAKSAGTRRGVADGATIVETSEGFCLLELGEGADAKSYNVIHRGEQVAKMHNGRWRESEDSGKVYPHN